MPAVGLAVRFANDIKVLQLAGNFKRHQARRRIAFLVDLAFPLGP